MNHLTQLNSILELRQAAKSSNTGSFLHTSAASNAKLILSFLQDQYESGRYVPTSAVVRFMNQSQPNVARLLKGLYKGGIIKRVRIEGQGKPFGWSARP
jgi:DNA-binding transcriptional ArsR family regulator